MLRRAYPIAFVFCTVVWAQDAVDTSTWVGIDFTTRHHFHLIAVADIQFSSKFLLTFSQVTSLGATTEIFLQGSHVTFLILLLRSVPQQLCGKPVHIFADIRNGMLDIHASTTKLRSRLAYG